MRRLLAASLSFAALAAPAAAQPVLHPQPGIQLFESCKSLTVREQSANTNVPLGCIAPGGTFRALGDGSAPTVTPDADAASNSLVRMYADQATAFSGKVDATGGPSGTTITFARMLAARASDVVNVLDAPYNAVGDGATDDWPAIQKAVNAMGARGGGTVLIPPTPAMAYRMRQALRQRSGVAVQVHPSVTMRCTGDANYSDASVGLPAGGVAGRTSNYPFFSCLMFGAVEPGSLPLLPVVAAKAIALGDTVITPRTSTDTAAWVVGDMLMVETTTTYAAFPGDFQASWRQLNRVVSRNGTTGAVTLLYPIEQAVASPQLRRLTNTGVNVQSAPGGDSGVPYWASRRASVRGGIWQPSIWGALTSGGALDCTFAPDAVLVTKGPALSMNTATGCKIEVPRITTVGTLLELAWGSAHNRVRIGDATTYGVSGPAAVWLNEGAHDNDYDINTLRFAGGNLASAVVINRASTNRVTINNLSGKGVTGPAVAIIASTPTSGTVFPKTTDNVVRVINSRLATQQQYAYISGADVSGNILENGRFYGALTDGSSIGFGLLNTGTDNIFRSLWGENGRPYCDTAGNTFADIHTPLEAQRKCRSLK